MTDTPNTKPSEAIQRYMVRPIPSQPYSNGTVADPVVDGQWVYHSDHLAALARARDEARREALEEAKQVCIKRRLLHLRNLESVTDVVRGHEAADCADAVGALIYPTPQGETKEQPHE